MASARAVKTARCALIEKRAENLHRRLAADAKSRVIDAHQKRIAVAHHGDGRAFAHAHFAQARCFAAAFIEREYSRALTAAPTAQRRAMRFVFFVQRTRSAPDCPDATQCFQHFDSIPTNSLGYDSTKRDARVKSKDAFLFELFWPDVSKPPNRARQQARFPSGPLADARGSVVSGRREIWHCARYFTPPREYSLHFFMNNSRDFLAFSRAPLCATIKRANAEVAQLAEHQLPKLRVAGSIPVFR